MIEGGGAASDAAGIEVNWSTDKNAPMVLLFGWAGCKDRYLKKYASFYEQKSYSTIRYTVPISKVRTYASYKRFARQVIEKVAELDEYQLTFPIHFHTFSMNGASLFSATWDVLSSGTINNGSTIKRNTKGIIFDSAPANVMPWQGADAVSFASMPPSHYSALSRNSYRYLLTGIFSLHRASIWLRSLISPFVYERNLSYFHMLSLDDLPRRQLYLYSDADRICDASSIEHFAGVQQSQGCTVVKQRWADSSHVEHLRKYPEEYAQMCIDFVEQSK